MREIRLGVAVAVCLTCSMAGVTNAAADAIEEFYRGKQVRMIVGHPAGGDYDLGGRLLAKYLTKRLPGHPSIVVQNMPTAGSIAAANYLYKIAPPDGTVFGSFSRNIPTQAILHLRSLEADPRRFQWLGATSLPGRVCVVRADAPVTKASDIFSHELLMAGAGPDSSLSTLPTVINSVLGSKFKLIEGYVGTVDGILAVERGEVDGICNTYGAIKASGDHIASGRVRILFRAEETALPGAPDAPSIFDFVKTEAQAQLMRFVFSSVEFGRPYVMPPNTPADRVQAMRQAFAEAAADPELIAEAAKINLDMTFHPAKTLISLVDKLYATPPHVIEEVRRLAPQDR
jgi:tripartite-type tricarboxylate transporter receptor subunit TctC